MTVQDVTSLVAHTGNGATTLWPYDFIIPDADYARVGLFDIPTGVLAPLDINDYNITGIGDANGGEVTYPLSGSPIPATKRVVIWREVPYTQDTDLTDQMPYYPTVLEGQLDRIVMQVQQLKEESERTFKVTPGSTATPDELIDQLFDVAVQAEAAAGVATTQAGIATTKAGEAAASVEEAEDLLAGAVQIVPQSFTEAQKGQARANIGAGVLGGFRNKLINGGFDVWQRGLGPYSANTGFTADRWQHFLASGGMSITRGSAIGAKWGAAGGLLDIYYAGNNASFAPTLFQRIEDARTLAGKKATVGVRITDPSVAGITLEVAVVRRYGTGGGASTSEFILPYTNIGAIPSFGVVGYLKHAFDIPDVEGKTFGEGHHLEVVFRVAENKAFSIQLSTAFLVEGDATAEADPFSPRHIQQELALCQRYYRSLGTIGGIHVSNNFWSIFPVPGVVGTMRGIPTLSTGAVVAGDSGTVLAASPTTTFATGAGTIITSALNGGTVATARWLNLENVRLDAEL